MIYFSIVFAMLFGLALGFGICSLLVTGAKSDAFDEGFAAGRGLTQEQERHLGIGA